MNLFTDLAIFFNNNFEGAKLFRPLFFNGIPALRFDLQDPLLDTDDDAYFTEVVKRMYRIHAATTSANDSIILLYQKYTDKRRKIRKKNYLFKQLNPYTASIQFKRNKRPVIDIDRAFARPADGSCQVIIKDKASNINFHNLYIATSHMDFNRIPLLTPHGGELYIVNLSRNTVTLMYDDRGCDLISPNVDLLRSYYNELSDLILEDNRAQILKTLKVATL